MIDQIVALALDVLVFNLAVYPALRELLAPQRPPGPDLFAARALWAILRYGRSACRDAILEGQYEDPRGLFFGGHQLEPGPTRYQAWMHDHLAGLGYLLCLDVHTGLGRYGRELLLYERNTNHTPADQLGRALEHRIQTVPAGGDNAYAVRGGFCRMPCRLLPQARVDFLTQEFGTYRMLHLLRVLRAENQAFHHLADSREWRTRLREALDPPDAGWREQVLKAGLQRLQAGLRWLERARIRAA